MPSAVPEAPAAPTARRLRVLMIGPLPPPVGGMASVVENLRAALAGQIDLRVLNNVKTTGVDRTLWQGVAAQLRLFYQLAWACVAWRPDLVHIHTCSWFTFWRNSADVLLARLLGRRVVLHIHGGQFAAFLGGLRPLPAWFARRVIRLGARVLVLGDGWKGLLDHWADPRRVVVVPNGVPVPPARAASTPADAPLRVICLAHYCPGKGQADLLRAIARCQQGDSGAAARRGITVELFGFEVAPGYQETLRALAAELGLAGAVRLPGPITGAEKAARLQAAGCFCLPSYDEGLPMSMLEAMAAGLPVVVTAVGAIPEAVVDGAEGLIYAPGDIDALARHLRTLRDDPTRATALGQAGWQRVVREFSLMRSAALLMEQYRAVSRDRGRGSAHG